MDYRELKKPQLTDNLLKDFSRRQEVSLVWEKDPASGKWSIVARPRIDDWSDADRHEVLSLLRQSLDDGGAVFGAFTEERLAGYVAVQSVTNDAANGVVILTDLEVAAELRGQGIGTMLFLRAADWARERRAKTMRLSAHPAIETQGFFLSLGCVDTNDDIPIGWSASSANRNLQYGL